MIRNRTIRSYAAALLLSSCAVGFSAVPNYVNPVDDEFPILAWYSIMPDSAQTPERYRELREAGFNISFSHFTSNAQVDRALNAMTDSGVRLMIMCDELRNDTEATVRKFKDRDGVVGWYLLDEPTAAGFPELREFRDRVYSADSSHLVYLNLLPNIVEAKALHAKDYDDYVTRFIDEVQPPMVSYDFYPILSDSSHVFVRPEFYDNLERVSRICRDRNMPFWAFCLSTAHDPYPAPDNVHMRFEAFSALAYGAQCIQYFTYWQPESPHWDFHHAPIDETGRRTNVYYLIRDLNREIHALTWGFLGSEVKAVGHTGKQLPMTTTRFAAYPSEIRSVEADGLGVLISHFVNGDKNFLMIVNRDIDHSQTLSVDKDACVSRVDSNGRIVSDHDSVTVVGPGDYILYTW